MNTLIGFVLAGLVLGTALIRHSFGKKSAVREKARARKESAKRELDQDRLDCLELARALDRQLDGAVRPKTAAAAASTDPK